MNENRSGVTSKVLTPSQALYYLEQALAIYPDITVVGITGPGDPFANPDETMETLRLVRANILRCFCVLQPTGLNCSLI